MRDSVHGTIEAVLVENAGALGAYMDITMHFHFPYYTLLPLDNYFHYIVLLLFLVLNYNILFKTVQN